MKYLACISLLILSGKKLNSIKPKDIIDILE
jgi:hypothetical protein